MSNSDLLKEAIADARAVKETAIANAKFHSKNPIYDFFTFRRRRRRRIWR